MNAYPGTQLEKCRKQIRVLRLLPAANPNDQIRVHLISIDLSDALSQYEALSYAWGERTQSRCVCINDKAEWPVTDNLYHALRRLRARRKEKILWVDAVCIDQGDTEEQSQQVSMMNEIYAAASRVLIWLGESEGANEVSSRSVKLRNLHALRSPFRFYYWIPHFLAAVQNTGPHWWERAWVIQEAACAKKVEVLFGPCKMSFDSFYETLRTLGKDYSFNNATLEELCSNVWNGFFGIRRTRKRYADKKLSLGTLVFETRHTVATVPHDKVYSLMNLTAQLRSQDLVPNYLESVAETFGKATCAIIAAQRNLDCLGYVKLSAASNIDLTTTGLHPTRAQDLPSWAIDFRDMAYYLFYKSDHFSPGRVWDDATTETSNVNYLEHGRVALIGRVLGYVRETVPILDQAETKSTIHVANGLCRILSQAAISAKEQNIRTSLGSVKSDTNKREKPSCPNSQNWRELMFDAKRAMKFFLDPDPSDYDYLANGFEMWEEAAGFPQAFPVTPEGQDHLLTVYSSLTWYGNVARYSGEVSGSCVAFATACGFPGVAPAGTKAGDCIAVLDGGRLPIVLSPHAQTEDYVFRGFAYVHGFMARGDNQWQRRPMIGKQHVQRCFNIR